MDWRPGLNIVTEGGVKVGKDQINLLQTNNRFFENVGAINFLEKMTNSFICKIVFEVVGAL